MVLNHPKMHKIETDIEMIPVLSSVNYIIFYPPLFFVEIEKINGEEGGVGEGGRSNQ